MKKQIIENLPNGSVRVSYADNKWVRIPHRWAQDALKGLRPSERWVLVALMSYRGITGLIYPSLRELSATTGFSLRGVAQIIDKLEKLKKIRITKTKGKYNSYQMLC
jgi:DNA-binding MarR family transcriptional regulator